MRRSREESERLLEEASQEARQRESKKQSNFSDNGGSEAKPAEVGESEKEQYLKNFINTPLFE